MPLHTRRVDPAALREAIRLAGGDLRRLDFQPDGSVVVRAKPRNGTGPAPVTRRHGKSATPSLPSTKPAIRAAAPFPPPDGSALDERLPDDVEFTTHALERCREFAIAPGTLARIVERPDMIRVGELGRVVMLRDDVPEWCVVVSADGPPHIVVTVLRRSYERWSHE